MHYGLTRLVSEGLRFCLDEREILNGNGRVGVCRFDIYSGYRRGMFAQKSFLLSLIISDA